MQSIAILKIDDLTILRLKFITSKHLEAAESGASRLTQVMGSLRKGDRSLA
jgi:hypothetical protein